MKKILITGATGMVGTQVLEQLLQNENVSQIISIGRRKTGITNKKLKEIIHADFMNFSSLKEELINIDVCFYCLGVYQNQISNTEYEKITCSYQKALTDILEETSPKATFVLFGAAGADPSEKSRILFARVKGKAENLLNSTKFHEKYIFRPGYIHPTGKRKPPGWSYKIGLPVFAILFKLFPSIGISDKDLAAAMIKVGLYPKFHSRVFENSQIRELLT